MQAQLTLFTEYYLDEKRMRIRLHNASDTPLSQFLLCFTLTDVPKTEDISNANIIRIVGSFIEIQHPSFILQAHSSWTFCIECRDKKYFHASDQPAQAFVVLQRDSIEYEQVLSLPPRYIANVEGQSNTERHATLSTNSAKDKSTPIIPRPATVQIRDEVLDSTSKFTLTKAIDDKLRKGIESFTLLMEELSLESIFVADGGIPLKIHAQETETQENNEQLSGAYNLDVDTQRVTITTDTSLGVLYACISLLQLFHTDTNIACIHIEDEPRFAWRGMMLDTVRQYYSVAEIKRIIRILALHKLNIFHWHITDDEAWRIELDAYPRLAQEYGYRGYEENLPPFFGSGYKKSGGSYSKLDIQHIVDYAEKFGITIMPEFDVPGHCMALIEALPELQEAKDKSKYSSVQGYTHNVLNPALEGTYTVLDNIMKELCEVFSSRYFHFGCDERAELAWTLSPACKKMLLDNKEHLPRKVGAIDDNVTLKEDALHYLQSYFVSRVEAMLHKQGKEGVAWEEALTQGEVHKSTIIFSWKGVEAGLLAASMGYKVVMCPGQYYYLDMAQSQSADDIGLSWAGISSVYDSYNYEAIPDGFAEAEQIIGLQANLWSENMWDKSRVDYMLFPRLAAVAESAWSKKEHKNFEDFSFRLQHMYYPLLDSLGVGYKKDY